ncbi:MAG: hypothetical protein DMG67_02835 [Acidobacteria bacterium]|nr:MAG: hypothetical protein DMG67_02835 [Acidobacteriota bacterium]
MTFKNKFLVFTAIAMSMALLFTAVLLDPPASAEAGLPATGHYQVLSPITHGNLTIFPVVASTTEMGRVQALVRRPGMEHWTGSDSARVNQLVLVNNSKRPLVLLAGEIVTGGKQDRIVGKDRIIPAETEADLSVFCVEPGRWTESTASFGGSAGYMAAPSIRNEAMAKKDQNGVWDKVRSSNGQAAEIVAVSPEARDEIASTSSYARVMNNKEVQKQVDKIAVPIEHSYQNEIGELRNRNAVGVVVAVNGRIIWADLFASTSLLEKYWPKLVRSYAAEAMNTSANGEAVSVKAAQAYLDQLEGRREIAESEPGVYRHTEIIGDGFKAFELTSLLPSTGFDVHISKMTE